jgi:hypothetical protein
MKNKRKLPNKRSLGGLRRNQSTNPNAPEFIGTMRMQRSTLLVLLKQLNETAAEEVICKIAGWENSGNSGPFLTVEVSPRFVPKNPEPAAVAKKTATLHAFFWACGVFKLEQDRPIKSLNPSPANLLARGFYCVVNLHSYYRCRKGFAKPHEHPVAYVQLEEEGPRLTERSWRCPNSNWVLQPGQL